MASTRYTVFNPDGEQFETPQDSRAAQLRQALMMEAMGGGRGRQAQLPSIGGDAFFAEQQQPLSLRDQVQAQRDLIRERNNADLALGAQRNQGQLDVTGLQDTGQTTRARIGIEPAMGRLGLDREQYGDVRPAVQSEAALRAKAAALKGGIYDDIGRDMDPNRMGPQSPDEMYQRNALKFGLLGMDPNLAVSPQQRRLQGFQDQTAKQYLENNPDGYADVVGAIQSGDYTKLTGAKRLDQRSLQEAEQATALPEVQQSMVGLADYISSVSGWWSDANIGFVKDRIASLDRALTNARVSPTAKQMVMERMKNLVSNSLDSEDWDASGADSVRQEVGRGPRGDKTQQYLNTAGRFAAYGLLGPGAPMAMANDLYNNR
jgi:hypothetical protein